MHPVVITATLLGAETTRARNPNLPLTPAEIATAVQRTLRLPAIKEEHIR